jgi:hypothetical protein
LHRVVLTAAAASALLAASGGAAPPVPIPGPGHDARWRPVTFARVPRTTSYEPMSAGGLDAVRATSACAASGLVFPLDGFDLARTPVLRWRWRIDEALAPPATGAATDVRTKAGDDFPARVYVLFRFDAAQAGLAERARHALASTFRSDEVPGAAFSHVIAPHEPAGAHWGNPYAAASKMVSRGALAPGTWREESADVEADYRALPGGAPPPALGLALMTDTDDGCGRAVAWYAGFRFTAREE